MWNCTVNYFLASFHLWKDAESIACDEKVMIVSWPVSVLFTDMSNSTSHWNIALLNHLIYFFRIHLFYYHTTANNASSSSHPQPQKIYAQTSFHPAESSAVHNSDHIYQSSAEMKTSKIKPERIYTSAADRNNHYQQLQQQHQYQPPQPQQHQHNHQPPGAALLSDGNCVWSFHQ